MSDILKNLLVGIVAILMCALGYYLYTQSGANTLSLDGTSVNSDDLLSRTEIFIERRAVLEAITIKIDLFSDPRFTSLRSYTTSVPEQSVGRLNIFDAPGVISKSDE